MVVDNRRRGIDGCGSGAADRRRCRGIPILESVLPEYLMKKLIILLGLPVIFCSLYAQHTHNNVKLTRETKIIAITILAEARGEGHGGMYAVAAVIAQRAFERKRTPTEICLKPYQFSCWNGKTLKRLGTLVERFHKGSTRWHWLKTSNF